MAAISLRMAAIRVISVQNPLAASQAIPIPPVSTSTLVGAGQEKEVLLIHGLLPRPEPIDHATILTERRAGHIESGKPSGLLLPRPYIIQEERLSHKPVRDLLVEGSDRMVGVLLHEQAIAGQSHELIRVRQHGCHRAAVSMFHLCL